MSVKNWILPLLGSVCPLIAQSPEPWATLEVRTGAHSRQNTPLSAPLTPDWAAQLRDGARLIEKTDHGPRPIPAQAVSGSFPRLCFLLDGTTPAGTTRTFALFHQPTPAASQVELQREAQFVSIICADRPILRYHHAPVPPPAGYDRFYERSGFIHPLWSPGGVVLTQIHPRDHIHHLGLWGPWTETEYQGREIDFWNLNRHQGTVRFVAYEETHQGPVTGGFIAQQDHVWLQAPSEPRVVLKERLAIDVWNLGEAAVNVWLMDYTTRQRCATDSPLLLQAYRYGGLGFRGTSHWHNQNSDYLTSEGKSRADGDATRARWCDVFGETGQGIEGLLFLSHVENHAHPEPMRIWPSSSNNGRGDVFFNFCPVREDAWLLEPGREYVLRYRLFSHSGKLSPAEAERLWQDFTDPPKVTLTPTR